MQNGRIMLKQNNTVMLRWANVLERGFVKLLPAETTFTKPHGRLNEPQSTERTYPLMDRVLWALPNFSLLGWINFSINMHRAPPHRILGLDGRTDGLVRDKRPWRIRGIIGSCAQ